MAARLPRRPRTAQWRPVSATVTPTPIMASPPAPPTISTRRGERANQARTALAANPRAVRDRSDDHRDQRQQQHLLRYVPGRLFRTGAGSRRTGCALVVMPTTARPAAPPSLRASSHRHRLGQPARRSAWMPSHTGTAHRDLHDHEHLRRPFQQRAQADGHARCHHVVAACRARWPARSAPVRQRPPDHEQHPRPGDDDQHQRRQREAQQLLRRNQEITPRRRAARTRAHAAQPPNARRVAAWSA